MPLWPWSRPPSDPPPDSAGPEASEPDPSILALREVVEQIRGAVTELQQAQNALVQEVASLAGDMDRFEKDLEEGLEIARRRENRIRAAVARAQAEFEESGEISPGYQAEVAELRRSDGERGSEEGVFPLHPEVAEAEPSSIPGLTLEELNQANGLI